MDIHGGYQGGFAQVAFPLPILTSSKVAASLFPAQNFAGSSDFKTFGDAFTGLATGNFLSHEGGEFK